MASVTVSTDTRAQKLLSSAKRSSGWAGYVARRLGLAVIVVWLAYTVGFLLLWVLPGDAALARLGGGEGGSSDISEEDLAALRERLGLDQPLFVQYLTRLGGVLVGDLGLSLRNDRPVTQVISESLGPTVELALLALVISVVVGGAIAIAIALSTNGIVRRALLMLPAIGTGVPVFWAGLLLISAFSFGLGWFPAGGSRGFEALILPAVTLSIVPTALIANVLAASLRESLAQPYARTTAPAKGAGAARVVFIHCLRNACLPALTVFGVVTGSLLAGTVVIDTVFSRAGIGRVLFDAVNAVDLTVVQGVILFAALIFAAVNLVVDLLYPVLDPRLHFSKGHS